MNPRFRYMGVVNGALTATSGTIACGNALQVNFQPILDTNSAYEVAVKPVTSGAGTASKANCAAIVTDLGMYTAYRPSCGGNWWLARTIYSGATAIKGSGFDKYTLEKLG